MTMINFLCVSGALILKGPEGPVLEGDYVTLECLADVESNMSQVHFEKFSMVSISSTMICWEVSCSVANSVLSYS